MKRAEPIGIRPGVAFLLEQADPAIRYFARRDLLSELVGSLPECVWSLPEPRKLLKGQEGDGAFKAKTGGYPPHHGRIAETFKRLRLLVERYQFDRSSAPVEAAAEYLFSTQTAQGDFRGMVGN